MSYIQGFGFGDWIVGSNPTEKELASIEMQEIDLDLPIASRDRIIDEGVLPPLNSGNESFAENDLQEKIEELNFELDFLFCALQNAQVEIQKKSIIARIKKTKKQRQKIFANIEDYYE